jgi:hypothetical protein
MKISTTQEYALVACCDTCPPPGCAAPKRECESKSVTQEAVGWFLGSWRAAYGIIFANGFSEDDIPCPDKTRVYRSVFQIISTTSSDPDDDYGPPVTLESSIESGATFDILFFPTPANLVGDIFSGGPVDNYSDGVFSGTFSDTSGDVTVTTSASVTFSDPIDLDWLISEAAARFTLLDWESNGECKSSTSTVYAICDEVITEEPESISVTQARYRIGIPATENYAGYDDAKDAWDALPADERGPEPIQYPYFAAQWDEVFFPELWSEWDNGGQVGTEPTPKPSLVASRSWTYAGTAEFSAWFEIPIPETEGETRIVNMRTKCHRSTKFGVLPTAHDETYPIDE